MNNNFKNWIAPKIQKKTSSNLDARIFKQAESLMIHEKNYFNLGLSVAAFAMFAILILNVGRLEKKEMNTLSYIESPDLITHYNEIELMANADQLDDSDWNNINRNN
jgi:hypothetical protein